MKTICLIISLLISLLPTVLFSQDGSPDPTFGNNGVVITDIDGGDEHVHAVAQSATHRLLVIGLTLDTQNEYKNFIAAYLEDGNIDTGFGLNGILVSDTAISGTYSEIKIQNGENFLIGSNSSTNYKITRFLPDGEIDATFAIDGVLSPFTNGEFGRMFLLDSNDKFIVMGEVNINGHPNIVLKRFLPDGELDTDFGSNGMVNFPILNVDSFFLRTFNIQEDSKIVVNFSYSAIGVKSRSVIRFLTNGAVDDSFGINGIAEIPELDEDSICRILSFSDGSVLVSCRYFDFVLGTSIKKMLKLSSDGSLDENFGSSGYVNGSMGTIIQPNQRIIADNSDTDWEGGINLSLRRFYSNGNSDGSFQFSTNYGTLGAAIPILLNSGKILVAGSDIWYNFTELNIVLQQFNNNPLSVPDFDLEKVLVSPNPSSGLFRIEYSILNTSEIPYQITDVTGKVIQKGNLSASETIIDLSSAHSGMYFLRVANTTLRLIKD